MLLLGCVLNVCLSATAEPLRVATFGTSLTNEGGWQEPLAMALRRCMNREVEVLNLAKSGATSDWGAANVGRVVAADPDTVLIEFSVNDASLDRFMSLSHSKRNVRAIVRAVHDRVPRADIYLMTMNPVTGLRKWMRPFLDSYYDSYASLARELGVGFIDNRPGWSRLSDGELAQAMLDGLHPKPIVVAQVIVSRIATAIAGHSCEAASR